MSPMQTEEFRERLSDFNTAVLVTRGRDEPFRARPMAIAGVDENCDLWLVTSRDFAGVHEIGRAAIPVLITAQTGWGNCVCIAGLASLSDKPRSRQRFAVWFPFGVDDPEVALIHFSGEQGEYWDSKSINRCMYIYENLDRRGFHREFQHGSRRGQLSAAR